MEKNITDEWVLSKLRHFSDEMEKLKEAKSDVERIRILKTLTEITDELEEYKQSFSPKQVAERVSFSLNGHLVRHKVYQIPIQSFLSSGVNETIEVVEFGLNPQAQVRFHVSSN